MFGLQARDADQEEGLRALFDRGEAYAEWRAGVQSLRAELAALGETAARRRYRSVAEALQALQAIDYFPGVAREQAVAELEALRREIDAVFSAGEPQPSQGVARRLDPVRHTGASVGGPAGLLLADPPLHRPARRVRVAA